MDRIVERPGALDVHKASVMACVRVWEGRELEEHVAEFQTTVQGLLALPDRLPGVRSGGLCTIGAERHISIGSDSMLGEMVRIRDHDHDPAYPPRSGRSQQADVRIGARVWIAAKASVVRGGTIGDDAVIGAHTLVNRPVPARSLVGGVPARVIRLEIKADPT
jgi:hypothetical protein